MRLRASVLLCIAFAGATAWLVFETKRLAELAGRYEIEARGARAQAVAAQAELAALTTRHAAAQVEITRLETEVGRTAEQLAAMAEAVQQRAAAAEARAAAAQKAEAAALAPIPEGVRTCLASLQECLRAEGFGQQRFVSARALDEEGLHDVELVETHADGLGVDFVRAGRMTAELDRGKGRLVLRFHDGHRTEAGERVALPADGWPIVFEPIEGRLFEHRLPFLVRGVGAYPEPEVSGRGPQPGDFDPTTRLQWLERFDRLLAAAGTDEELRINRCRGLLDARFLAVQLLGTDTKHRLLSSADCARLAVEIDERAGVVSLLLQDGVLRRGGKESTITAEGYRMLLPKVTPKQARDVMLGMVVTK
jgi:hypothetical protein